MVAPIVRLIALFLVLAAVLCVGVMFVGGIAIMFEIGRAGEPAFDAVVARIRELRAWGLTGIGLFLLGAVLLWFTPGRRGDQSEY